MLIEVLLEWGTGNGAPAAMGTRGMVVGEVKFFFIFFLEVLFSWLRENAIIKAYKRKACAIDL